MGFEVLQEMTICTETITSYLDSFSRGLRVTYMALPLSIYYHHSNPIKLVRPGEMDWPKGIQSATWQASIVLI